jgi:hypothetical protein
MKLIPVENLLKMAEALEVREDTVSTLMSKMNSESCDLLAGGDIAGGNSDIRT